MSPTERALVIIAGNGVRTIAAAHPDHEAERGQGMGMMIVGPSDPTAAREMVFDSCLWTLAALLPPYTNLV